MGGMIRAWLAILSLIFLLPTGAWAEGRPMQLAAADTQGLFPSADALLAKTLDELRANRLDAALSEVDRLISSRPNFKLAHLIKGDLLMARTRPLPGFGAGAKAPPESLTDLREEARVRLRRYTDQPDPHLLPRQILQLAPDQKYALLADAERARLYVFENVKGEPRLVADFYMTIGRNGVEKQVEGDKKTPVGLYTISDQLSRQKLTDFYGDGAFPLDYPNEWDLLQKRTGHGIWIHGVPSDTYSRPPRASDGCVVVSNPDLGEIRKYVQVGVTPVMIAQRTEWVERSVWQAQRQALLAKLEGWRLDWESRDADRFLAHYADSFFQTEGKGWANAKRRNIGNKEWIRLGLADLNLFLYPSGDLAVATFTQDYASNAFRNATVKRLYLKQENGQWRIALERNLKTVARASSGPGATRTDVSPTLPDTTMVKLQTNLGDITLELYPAKAPDTVANFLQYVRDGHYDGTIFHRVIDGFMIQGGGFTQDMEQKPTRTPIQNEAHNGLKNAAYSIAMARTPNPHSATSQFFINVVDNGFLDYTEPTAQGYGYCVFGRVVDGTDVVDRIRKVKTGMRAGHQDVPVENVIIEKASLVEEN